MQQATLQLYTLKHRSNTHFQKNKLNTIHYIFGILHQMWGITHQSNPYTQMLYLLHISHIPLHIAHIHSLTINILVGTIHINHPHIGLQQLVHNWRYFHCTRTLRYNLHIWRDQSQHN